jgi:hypothetical protein
MHAKTQSLAAPVLMFAGWCVAFVWMLTHAI